MPASAPSVPSDQQLTRCGLIWDGALRRQCEAILVATEAYPWGMVGEFALYRWDKLGLEVQRDIARAMLALGALLRTAV
jgi:hypothetical protein